MSHIKIFIPASFGLIVILIISLFFVIKNTSAACISATGTNIRVYGTDALISGKDLSAFQASETKNCIAGDDAKLNINVIQTMKNYDTAKSVYFDQNKSTTITKQDWTNPDDRTQTSIALQDPNKDQLDHIKGNLTLTGNITGAKTRVIFVDGNLIFDQASIIKLEGESSSNGLVFVVKGNIYIKGSIDATPSVNQINAILISFGEFCDYSNPIGTACPLTTVTNSKKLIINGAVIYLNPTVGSKPGFVRSNKNNDPAKPAEELNYDPKYLVILKDIFAKDLSIWREIQ